MKNLENSSQLNINFNPLNQPEKKEEKDKEGRTRADIVKLSKSLNQAILNSISFKNSQYYIEGQTADDWIEMHNEIDRKDPDDYIKGQW